MYAHEWKECGEIRVPSANARSRRTAESFSPTTESSQAAQLISAEWLRAEGALQGSGARKAGMLASQNFLHKLFARVSPVFLALTLALSCANTSLAQADSETHNNSSRRQAAP